nr:mitochondrial fission ELM1 family protein [Sedimenticola hydrogenitrophicus]
MVIWRLTDGKPGHENQSLGLSNALARRLAVTRHDIPAGGRLTAWIHWLSGRFPSGHGLPPPDLIIGAGHQTHLGLLAARRAFGGRAVVIMKPTLPRRLFDLCVIPEHDGVSGDNVFLTRGVMNTIAPGRSASGLKQPGDESAPTEPVDNASAREDAPQTLILLGGTSPHYKWRDEVVLNQVEAIVRQQPAERFLLSDSRRTPAGCMEKIAALRLANLSLIPWRQTGPGWVAEQLGLSHAVWVSEDSVSMVYEALTSGAAVGLITLEQNKPGRISGGVERLVTEGWVTPFGHWREAGGYARSPGVFDEAARCAAWMVEQWL